MDDKIKIGVVIVTYNSKDWIDACLESLRFANAFIDEVVVVDNASADGIEDNVSIKGGNVKYFPLMKNIGFGRANNIGINYCLNNGVDMVLLLNADAKLQAGTIDALIKVLLSDATIGIVGGVQLEYDSDKYNGFTIRNVYKATESGLSQKFIYSEMSPGEYLSGSMVLMTRAAISRIGAFDPIYHVYAEDHDLFRRALKNDVKLAISVDGKYHHSVSHSYKSKDNQQSLRVKKIRHYSRSRLIHALANPDTPFLINIIRFLLEILRAGWEYKNRFSYYSAVLSAIVNVPYREAYMKHRRDYSRDCSYYLKVLHESNEC